MVWRDPAECPVGRVGQATCGVVSLAVAIVSLAVGYSVVLAVVSVLPLLSTTALVFVGVFVWLVTWLVLLVGVSVVRSQLAPPATATR